MVHITYKGMSTDYTSVERKEVVVYTCIEKVIKREENSLTTYFKESTIPMTSRLANIMAKEGILKGDLIDKEKNKIYNETITLDKWTAKIMHGHYRRQSTTIADPSSLGLA